MSGTDGRLRWRLVEEDDASNQGALFDGDELLDRHVGTGEFRGMEFLHVNARTIINQVPAASRMPFRYTINVYRGCSHACVYCADGETPILMADRRTKPIKDVRAGDRVYGTAADGPIRRYVTTPVVAQWRTTKPAFRLTLEDGTQLTASSDHRFLSERGWKQLAGLAPRLSLNDDDKLVGAGAFARMRTLAGIALGSEARLRVASIEPLGIDLPMYDITTGTGDFIANGVVSHNCFARPTHEYLGLNIGEDFDRRIVVKVNAVERLRAELAGRRWAGHHIAMGTNTDPYQRCEGKYHLTQGVVRVLGDAANPFSILTKSTLVLRDLDLLRRAAQRAPVRVDLSIGTLDEDVWRLTEPGTPMPRKRIEAVRRINDAGIPCGVLVAPILPGLSDNDEQLEDVVTACVEAGAMSVSTVALHLRSGVRDHYLGWLARARPDLMASYRRRYGRRSYLPAADQANLTERVRRIVERAEGRHRAREPRPAFPASLRRGAAPPGDDPSSPPAQLPLGFSS